MADGPDLVKPAALVRTRVAVLTLPELCDVLQQHFDAQGIAVFVEDRAPVPHAPRLVRIVEDPPS